ncbi:hypothetical protein HQQ81_01545 [Microbacteriaceae bacterium VKM Ac-2854]|nr:hypothetical protein [Microbacteriaceae bacterium VKM Ac-2854]
MAADSIRFSEYSASSLSAGGRLGLGNAISGDTNVPNRVVTDAAGTTVLTGATAIGSYAHGGMAIVGGQVMNWGTGVANSLGDGTSLQSRFYAGPVLTAANTPLTGIVKLGMTGNQATQNGNFDHTGITWAISGDGTLYSWGRCSDMSASTGASDVGRVYAAVDSTAAANAGKVIDVHLTFSSVSVIRASDNKVISWGNNSYGLLADGQGDSAGAGWGGIKVAKTGPSGTDVTGARFTQGNLAGRTLIG